MIYCCCKILPINTYNEKYVMKITKQTFSLLIILLMGTASATSLTQPSKLKTAIIDDFQTISGEVIKDLKVKFRTVGKLDASKSNVVLWPTWFTGTSADVFTTNALENTLNTKGLYIVIVDALGNGVSSSPSNSEQFPEITIRDMVNSQHKLLLEHLKISHLRAIVGISMGGMQAYEWLVSYPNFMDKAITIVSTPKQSSFDILVWQTQAALITHAQNQQQKDIAIKRAYDIFQMNLLTPTEFSKKHAPEDLQKYLTSKYENMMAPNDYLASIQAMIKHDIYKSTDTKVNDIQQKIKAQMLTIVSESDHLVNPMNSIALAKQLMSDVYVLAGNNGHMAAFLQSQEIKKSISSFLAK